MSGPIKYKTYLPDNISNFKQLLGWCGSCIIKIELISLSSEWRMIYDDEGVVFNFLPCQHFKSCGAINKHKKLCLLITDCILPVLVACMNRAKLVHHWACKLTVLVHQCRLQSNISFKVSFGKWWLQILMLLSWDYIFMFTNRYDTWSHKTLLTIYFELC